MKINFILPRLALRPVGGYKVIYQYANELSIRGHQVTVVHSASSPYKKFFVSHAHWLVANVILFFKRNWILRWFLLHEDVKLVIVPYLNELFLPNADATVLTSWETSELLGNLPGKFGTLFQIVYDYKFWMSQDENRFRIEESLLNNDIKHIATSSVVEKMLMSIGVEYEITIRAGLSEHDFFFEPGLKSKQPLILFPARTNSTKGLSTAVEAMKIIHSENPEVKIECFGSGKIRNIPQFIKIHRNLSDVELRNLYNRASIFVFPSTFEGFGLPALEAMSCGCVVVSTKCGGIDDFLKDGINSLLVAVNDPISMASAIARLLSDNHLCTQLRSESLLESSTFRLKLTVDSLERYVVESL